MELSGPVADLVKLFSPDGKSFDRETFKKLAADFADTESKLDSTINQPLMTPAERLDLSVDRATRMGDVRSQNNQRIVEQQGQLQNQANDAYSSQLGAFTDNTLRIMQPSLDSLDRGRQLQSDDLRYTIDDQSGHKDRDRDLRRRAQTMNMIQKGIGGGLLLLDILKN